MLQEAQQLRATEMDGEVALALALQEALLGLDKAIDIVRDRNDVWCARFIRLRCVLAQRTRGRHLARVSTRG